MKLKKMLLYGGIAFAAYWLFLKPKQAALQNDTGSVGGATSDALNSALSVIPGAGVSKLLDLLSQSISALQNIALSKQAVQAGGAVTSLISGTAFSSFSPGAKAAIANVDYINAVLGSRQVKVDIIPARSAPVVQLSGASGASVESQRYIDTALRAVPPTVPLYGVTPVTGGAKIFNFPEQQASALATGRIA